MPAETSAPDPNDVIVAAWRAESARLVGALTRMTRDVELAEDLAQDALVAALEQWPTAGVPANPGAWLMTTAKRRGVDHFRRADVLRRKVSELGRGVLGEEEAMPDLDAQVDHIEDDVLRLIFLTCHPALSGESRAALTLRLVGGLTTAEIARGFLVAESAMGQRISRAKRTLTDAHAELELPTGAERTRRLDDVMAVIYLIFNEGYSATAGTDWMRPDLSNEAMRLARMLAVLAPDEPEVLGLQALLELQGSRMAARLDESGAPVLLEAQDRTRWDQLLIRRGTAALHRAELLAAAGRPVGKYFLQASIAVQHARAERAEDTDWRRIAALYDVLADAAPGPVVEVNRAVAHGRAFGPDAGLSVLDRLDAGALGDSPLVPSVRGDLLERAGLHGPAGEAFTEAAARSRNDSERALLRRRAGLNRERPVEQNRGMEPTDVSAYLAGVTPLKRARDAHRLVELMKEVTGEEPRLWGTIIGFGTYHYRYESGREGDGPAAAFAARKSASTIYLPDGTSAHERDLATLGPHSTSVGCLYLKDLDDVDLDVLKGIVGRSYETLSSGTYDLRAREGGQE